MTRVVLIGFVLVVQATTVFGQSATAKAVRAQRAREAIKLQLAPDKKTIMVAVDKKSNYAPLKKDQTFTTTGAVDITFDRLNPMTTLISVDVADADDPTNATIGKLVAALLEMTATIRPDLATDIAKTAREDMSRAMNRRANVETCGDTDEAIALLAELDKKLFSAAWSAAKIQPAVKSWAAAIDTRHRALASGPEAVQAAITLIDSYLKGDTDESLESILKQATAAVEKAATAVASGRFGDACRQEANSLYHMIRLTNPQARLAAIKTIYGSITDLRKTLDTVYGNPSNWFGDRKIEYISRRAVEPTSEKMQVITIKAVALDYTALDTVTPIVLAKKEDLVTGAFTIRQYSFLIPEIGGGATFSRFARPKFGTAQDAAGKTIVAESKEEELSVDPTVMVNFVCHGCPASVLTPMIQVGVSTSKESPTLFLGGGIRLFNTGKGEFAIGFGRAFPWVKQLKSLKPGDPVGGTKDIEADLEFRRLKGKRPTYIALQYKF